MMAIPEPPPRYPTAAAIDSLARRFGLPNGPNMQDWSWEVAGAGRLDEFLAAYENGGLDDDERFTLMEILLQSFEDLGRSTGFDSRWDRTLEILDRNIDLHACSVWYWSSLENDNLEDQWLVAPFLRRLVEKHRGRFENA